MATEIMLVQSPYALDNQAKYAFSKKFLTEINGQSTPRQLHQQLEQMDDPGLRAFLELNLMAKGK